MSIKYSPWSNEIAIYIPEEFGNSSSSSSRLSSTSTISNNSAGSNNSSISSTSPGISSSSIQPTSINKSIYFDYNNAPLTQKYSVSDNQVNNPNQIINTYYTGTSITQGGFDNPGILFSNFGISLDLDPLSNSTFNGAKTFDASNVFVHPSIGNNFINNENVDIFLTGSEGSKLKIDFMSFFSASGSVGYSTSTYTEVLDQLVNHSGLVLGGPDNKGPITIYNKLLVLPNLSKLNQTSSFFSAFSVNINLKSKASEIKRSEEKLNKLYEYCGISGYPEPFLNKNISIKLKTISRPIWGNSLTRSEALDETKYYQKNNNWGWDKNNTDWYNLKLNVTTTDLNNNTFIVNCTPSLVYPGLKWRFSNIGSDLSNLNQYLYSHEYLNNSDGSPTGILIKTNYGLVSNDNSPFVGYINYKPYVLGMTNDIVENHPYYGCKLKIERN